jgi:hypothetical protein
MQQKGELDAACMLCGGGAAGRQAGTRAGGGGGPARRDRRRRRHLAAAAAAAPTWEEDGDVAIVHPVHIALRRRPGAVGWACESVGMEAAEAGRRRCRCRLAGWQRSGQRSRQRRRATAQRTILFGDSNACIGAAPRRLGRLLTSHQPSSCQQSTGSPGMRCARGRLPLSSAQMGRTRLAGTASCECLTWSSSKSCTGAAAAAAAAADAAAVTKEQ